VTFAGHSIAYVGRIDPRSNRITAEGYPAGRPSAIAVDQTAVWIANGNDSNTISRVHPQTAIAVETITVGRGPRAIAVGAGAVWVANSDDDTVSRVDPDTSSSATIQVGDSPSAVAVGEGAVWVANAGDGTVSRINTRTGLVTKTIRVGGRPAGLAVGAGEVWVAVQAPNA
jgi:peptide/nickel transport system substrate-binding protein